MCIQRKGIMTISSWLCSINFFEDDAFCLNCSPSVPLPVNLFQRPFEFRVKLQSNLTEVSSKLQDQ